MGGTMSSLFDNRQGYPIALVPVCPIPFEG